MKQWLLLALLLVSWSCIARADESVEDAAEEVEDVASDDEAETQQTISSGVFSRAVLNNVKDATFPSGEFVTSLITFRNEAENPNYRIVFVIGHLKESTYFVQNFTGNPYSRVVAGGEGTTVKYRFKADPSLESREYNLVIQVFFQNEDNTTYVTTAYNDTVTITDAATTFDAATVITYSALIGGAIAAVYFLKAKLGLGASRSKKQVSETGTESKAIDTSFVSEQHKRYLDRKSSSSPKRSSSGTK